MKKVMMLMVEAFAATVLFAADTDQVGDYTWTCCIKGENTLAGWKPTFSGKVPVANTTCLAQWRCDWILSTNADDTLTIVGINVTPSGTLDIPATIDGRAVTNIGFRAFGDCNGLTNVTIPASVTHIGSYAFDGCSGLASVAIPDSVTSIGNAAFRNCSGLVSVTLPSCITSIGSETFSGCSGLTSVTIPDSVTSIGRYAFKGCIGLTSLAIPDGMTNIGYHAFSGCSGLTSVTIPDSMTSIGDSAFSGCSGLTSVTIYDSVTSIGKSTFDGCSRLTHVTIPGSVTSIGYRAFGGCSDLTSVAIPDSVTNIEAEAFNGCSRLTSVAIPDSVTSIGNHAFCKCSGLASVTIGNGVMRMGEGVFADCSEALFDLSSIPGVKLVDGWAVDNTEALTGTLDLTDVRGIGGSAFVGCSGLTNVTIGNSVTSIGESAFSGCSGLEEITLPFIGACISDRGVTTSLFGYIFGRSSYAGSMQAWQSSAYYYIPLNLKKVVVTDDTVFGYCAFSGCSGLVSVTIPDSVTNIGNWAFTGCSGLANVSIPASVTSIGECAFAGCTGLTSMTFPDSVTNIGYRALGGCIGLTSVTIPDSVTNICESTFDGCKGLTRMTIPDSVTNIGGWAFSGCSGLTSVTIPSSVTDIGEDAFYGCGSLTCVYVSPGDVERVKRLVTDSGFDASGVRFIEIESEEAVEIEVVVPPGPEPPLTPTPTPIPEPPPESVPALEPATTQQTWIVTFNANGGTGTMAAQAFTGGVAQELTPNAFTRFGYVFAGWAESAGGEVAYADGQRVAVSSDRTLYALWEEVMAGRPDMSFSKAQTVTGALYDKDDRPVGTVQVKVGKMGKNGNVKLSASATLLADGKTQKVTAKAATMQTGSAGATLVFKAPIGEMAVELAADGVFTLKNASYVVTEATVGGALKGEGQGIFRLKDIDFAVPGELQEDLLPNEVAFDVVGGKWKFAKNASVKWAKDRTTKEYALVVDDTKGKRNLSSLKLTYAAKTGIFKGAFKVYALEEKNGKTKLAKYIVNVIGLVLNGVGQGEAACKKIAAGPWPVTVE